MKIRCHHCRKWADRRDGDVNRARKGGLPIYCDKRCAGLRRRTNKTKAQRVAEKREYDAAYRAKNLERIKADKREYHLRNYDPKKAAKERKKRMPKHVDYCRRPEYRVYKSEYDLQRRARAFGDYAESYRILSEIEKEINSRASRYEIYLANDTLNKRLKRKREYVTI